MLPYDTMKFIKIGKEFRVDFKNIKMGSKPKHTAID